MKKTNLIFKRLMALTLLAAMLVYSGCSDDDGGEPAPTMNLYETMQSDSDLSQLSAFIEANATLKAALEGSAEYTFFAPTNAAFETLKATLGVDDLSLIAPNVIGAVLAFHVAAGAQTQEELTGGTISTLEGESVVVNSDGTIQTGGSNTAVEIVDGDIKATNGIMHKVDAILVPPTINESIGVNLTTLAQPILLGADFTDMASIIATADSDVPSGKMAISAILADKENQYTVFSIPNTVFALIAASQSMTEEDLVASINTSATTARGFMLNQITDMGGYLGSDLVGGLQFQMMSGLGVQVVETTQSEQVPLGLVIASENSNAALFQLDIFDVNGTGAAVNGSIHVSSIIK